MIITTNKKTLRNIDTHRPRYKLSMEVMDDKYAIVVRMRNVYARYDWIGKNR
jgi:hypothetical protein